MISAETTYVIDEVLANDLNLITAAQQGDTRAFGGLVSRYQAKVVSVVYRMCGDPHLAEEAAQEAFLRAWQHLPGYDPRYSFRAWVYRIAINAALDSLRREKPTLDIDGMEDDAGLTQGGGMEDRGPEDPETALVRKERAQRVRQAVLGLPAPSRSVLVLREYAGLSYAEIADTLRIPLGTVMSRLNSARGQLRQALTGMLEVL
jgi:RNA polymerase sigma-70 factor, ECF subfamily